MIFLDTSAIYALADEADARHPDALVRLETLLSRRETFLTHNYVLVESLALLQNRLGHRAAVKLAESAGAFEIVWIDSELHQEAARQFAQKAGRRVSLVDTVSFLVMRRRGLDSAFAFDEDFRREGFRVHPE